MQKADLEVQLFGSLSQPWDMLQTCTSWLQIKKRKARLAGVRLLQAMQVEL
jgi:hypothetical protein